MRIPAPQRPRLLLRVVRPAPQSKVVPVPTPPKSQELHQFNPDQLPPKSLSPVTVKPVNRSPMRLPEVVGWTICLDLVNQEGRMKIPSSTSR